MATVALTGKDTIKINNRLLNDLADGDCAVITFPNDLASVKTGKNGNAVYAFNYSGEQVELELRLLRGSADDRYLNGLLALMKNDMAAFTLMQGEFVKNIGNGEGGIMRDTYILQGGIFKKNPEAMENAEGSSDQAIVVYSMAFGRAPRTIG